MARPVVLSNGEMHVGLNSFGLVHDFYYPYVGLENHAAGANHRHKIGLWVDGKISWVDEDPNWELSFKYPHTALVGHTTMKNAVLGITLEFDDCVDSELSAFLRNIHIINLKDEAREVRLFMHQAFTIGDSQSYTDTAQYLPDSDAILHYRGRRAFVISGEHGSSPFDQFSIGLFGLEGHDGTFKDAEDGELTANNVEHGRVDSTIRFKMIVGPHSSERVHYWITAGMSIREAIYIHKQVKDDGFLKRLHGTATWWHKWLQPAIKLSKSLPIQHQEQFLDSVMIIKSQIDKRGAVIASTDSSLLNYTKDAYGYSWPRDGAYAVWPLIRMGYKDEAYRFFEFSRRGLHPNGYLSHKYRADGAIGSSWHPYIHEKGIIAPPIQEDETALVVFVFAQFYEITKDMSLIKEFYGSMIVPMANFMASYVDDQTNLPKASYDLWEETFATSTYTVSVTYAALIAASELAAIAGDEQMAVKWRSSATDIQEAAHKYLYNEDRKTFYKGVLPYHGEVSKNPVLDASSVFGVFLYGLYDSDSEEVKNAVQSIITVFKLDDKTIGIPRYENDIYRRQDDSVLGNWWLITSLWLAQYYIEKDQNDAAMRILDWVKDQATPGGMFPEQINPITGAAIAPAPLTWSHAEYVSTLLDLITETR